MKLSISHIAWDYREEEKFLPLISKLGCTGVEIAPDRVWSDILRVTQKDTVDYRKLAKKHGLDVVAFQALLYTRRDLVFFKDKATDKQLVEYLLKLAQIAEWLGAEVLVLGSPSNRRRNQLPMNQAMEWASEVLFELSQKMKGMKTRICIEPLDPTNSDFINTAQEGMDLVNMVDANHTNIGLHLDACALSYEPNLSIDSLKGFIQHYHISEPQLAVIKDEIIPHQSFAQKLKQINYQKYVSIEMRMTDNCYRSVSDSLQYAMQTYIN